MIICERKLRRTVDADGHRRRNAPTFLPDRVPASHILIMPHSIDAESNKVVNAIIYIGSGALVIGVPHADCASSECFRHRKFGNDVKRSACAAASRSEEHTSELQSLMRISYAVFCLTK